MIFRRSELSRGERQRLLRGLTESFNLEDLKDLCFKLDIDHQSVPGDNLDSKARELIGYLDRRKRLSELLILCREERPGLEWPPPPEAHQISKWLPRSDKLPAALVALLVLGLVVFFITRCVSTGCSFPFSGAGEGPRMPTPSATSTVFPTETMTSDPTNALSTPTATYTPVDSPTPTPTIPSTSTSMPITRHVTIDLYLEDAICRATNDKNDIPGRPAAYELYVVGAVKDNSSQERAKFVLTTPYISVPESESGEEGDVEPTEFKRIYGADIPLNSSMTIALIAVDRGGTTLTNNGSDFEKDRSDVANRLLTPAPITNDFECTRGQSQEACQLFGELQWYLGSIKFDTIFIQHSDVVLGKLFRDVQIDDIDNPNASGQYEEWVLDLDGADCTIQYQISATAR